MVGRQAPRRAPELAELRSLQDSLIAGTVAAPEVALVTGEAEEGGLNRPFELLGDAVESAVAAWESVPPALAPRAHALGHVLGRRPASRPAASPPSAPVRAGAEALLRSWRPRAGRPAC